MASAQDNQAIEGRIGVSVFDDELSFDFITRQFAKNLTPQRIAGVFDDAVQRIADQVQLADEIEEADDHIRGTLALRRSAVQRLDKKIVPGDEDDERSKVAAEIAQQMIEQPWFHRLSASMLRATFLQYSAVEVLYTKTASAKLRVDGAPAELYMPSGVRPVESQRWHFNRQAKPELFRRLSAQSEGDAIPLTAGPFAWMEWETTAIPGQFAVVRCAAVLYIMARVDIKQWGTMIDQWGVPFISAMVEDGVSKEARRAIASELLALAGRRVVLTSKGAQLQTTDVPDQSPHRDFQDWVRRAISRLLVGQDSSQMAIEGQKTGATLQGNVRDDIRDEDALQLDAAQNETFFAPWCLLNFGPDVAPPRIERTPPEEIDPDARLPIYEGAQRLGIAVKREQVYRELKIEEPDAEDATLWGAGGGVQGSVKGTAAGGVAGGPLNPEPSGLTAPVDNAAPPPRKEPLSGIQITSAMDILARVSAGTLTSEPGRELLIALGFEEDAATRMITATKVSKDSGEADVNFYREIIRGFLNDGTINDVLYNVMGIAQILKAINVPIDPEYTLPWMPVITNPGLEVTGNPTTDATGDVVGSQVKPTPAVPAAPGGGGFGGFSAHRAVAPGAETAAGVDARTTQGSTTGSTTQTIDPSSDNIVNRASDAFAGIFKGHSAAIRRLAEEIVNTGRDARATDAEMLAELKRRLPEILPDLGGGQDARTTLLAKGMLAGLATGARQVGNKGATK